jgi:hypothetical protein
MLDLHAQDEYMDSQQNAPSWFFLLIWLGWVIVTIIGYLAGKWLSESMATAVLGNTPATRLLSIEGVAREAGAIGHTVALFSGILAGAALGLAQGLFLLPFMKVAGSLEWLLATIIGRTAQWMVIYIIGLAMVGLTVDKAPVGVILLFIMLIVTGVLSGVALGYPQSQVFKRRTRSPGWWIAANIIGSVAVSLVVGMTLFVEAQNTLRDSSTLMLAALTAVATGSALLEILHHPRGAAEWRETLTWDRDERSGLPVEDTVLGSSQYTRRPEAAAGPATNTGNPSETKPGSP